MKNNETYLNRSVKDIWKAIQISLYTVGVGFCCFYVVSILILSVLDIGSNHIVDYFINGSILLSVLFGVVVFKVYEKGVSLTNDTFSWPASDVENSLMDIFTLKRVRGLFYRESINATQIEYVTNDFGWKGFAGTKKKEYGLNISGDFGSRTIRFNSKQKRDEARNMLKRFSKSKIESDIAFN